MEKQAFQSFLSISAPRGSVCGMGTLGMLPPDLLLEIIEEYVDLQSLFRLRHVNEATLEVIQSLPKYQRALTYAPMTLWALIRTGFAQDITLNAFHIKLCSNVCRLCGQYGCISRSLSGCAAATGAFYTVGRPSSDVSTMLNDSIRWGKPKYLSSEQFSSSLKDTLDHWHRLFNFMQPPTYLCRHFRPTWYAVKTISTFVTFHWSYLLLW